MTKEEMQALRDMMKEEITNALEPIKDDISGIKGKLDEHDKRFEALETEIRHTRVMVEHQDHNIRLIAEQYGDISKKLERVNEIDELRDRVRTLETVAGNHSAAIKELRKAE